MNPKEQNLNVTAVYGIVEIEKRYCERCEAYAFYIDGEIKCCGKKYEEADRKRVIVRESEGRGKRAYISITQRRAILESQNFKCIYCGEGLLLEECQIDHVVPFSFVYGNLNNNYVAACKTCNLIKHNKMFKTMEEAVDHVKNKKEKRKEATNLR